MQDTFGKQVNYSIRISTKGWLGNGVYEDFILDFLDEAWGSSARFKCYFLLHDSKDLSGLQKFMKTCEGKLHWKTIIESEPKERVWFDIGEVDTKLNRFWYQADNPDGIVLGVSQFIKAAEFCSQPKHQQNPKQQRTDG